MTADASSSWRLAKAERFLAAAQHALDVGDWETAASRAYYAAYHAMIAVLETKEGIVRATWSHNFRPFYERYTYLRDKRVDIEMLYKSRVLADYSDVMLDATQGSHILATAMNIYDEMTRTLADG